MSLYPSRANASDYVKDQTPRRRVDPDKPLVLLVKDQEDTLFEMKQVLELSGYRVIDTDNGQDAAKRARYAHPDLVLVDLDVPLLYEVVAARQIMKHALLAAVPVVIIIHEEELDPYSMMEVCVRRNEYVTRLSGYEQLEHLLDYLLPVAPKAA
jgi:CheY-like chemotaxis protein